MKLATFFEKFDQFIDDVELSDKDSIIPETILESSQQHI